MPAITFKAKSEAVYNHDHTVAYHRVKVPATIKKHHCDMHGFRNHKKFGPYANSDLFPAIVKRELRNRRIGDYLRLDELPADVTADTSGYLAVVTINL